MRNQQKYSYSFWKGSKLVVSCLSALLSIYGCTNDYPALTGNPIPPVTATQPPTSTSACSCSGTSPGSATTTPISTSSAVTPVPDTLMVQPPRFSPDGGTFYFSTTVNLVADTLPAQAVYEYSLDNGQTWQAGKQLTIKTGGRLLTRFRVGDKVSRSRAATFSLYYKRMLVIGNSIMFHGPAAQLGWGNSNGMAASAPEKDFVHLLTAQLQALYPATQVRLQAGTSLELDFGRATYKMDEFDQPMQEFKPDLVIIRLGENMSDGEVPTRNFEGQFRQFIDRLITLSKGQSVKIVTTTSVWEKPQADAIIRKIIAEKGLTLVDLQCMVGQSQYFASGYANPGVAAHPGDVGMQRIADLIWVKVQ